MKQGNKFKGLLLYLAVILVLLWGLAFFVGGGSGVSYSEAAGYFRQEQVSSFVVEGNGTLVMNLRDGSVRRHALADVEMFRQEFGGLIEEQHERGVIKSYDFRQAYEMPLWLLELLPVAVAVVLALVFWMMLNLKQQGAQAGGQHMSRFGQARTTDGSGKDVHFADVAGADEEKAELQELVDFLREPQRFIDLGARIPKGVLLVGPPGPG